MMLALFAGGVRSGKTGLAEKWAVTLGRQSLMLATCHAADAEMAERIAAHKKARGRNWLCLEEPLDPLGALELFMRNRPDFAGAVVLDSLGMLISNLMASNSESEAIFCYCQKLLTGLKKFSMPVAIVTEECGLGFLPLNRLAREYGDLLGKTNQFAASLSDCVVFVACGLPLVMKGDLQMTH